MKTQGRYEKSIVFAMLSLQCVMILYEVRVMSASCCIMIFMNQICWHCEMPKIHENYKNLIIIISSVDVITSSLSSSFAVSWSFSVFFFWCNVIIYVNIAFLRHYYFQCSPESTFSCSSQYSNIYKYSKGCFYDDLTCNPKSRFQFLFICRITKTCVAAITEKNKQ